jgi:hypothetical protein
MTPGGYQQRWPALIPRGLTASFTSSNEFVGVVSCGRSRAACSSGLSDVMTGALTNLLSLLDLEELDLDLYRAPIAYSGRI